MKQLLTILYVAASVSAVCETPTKSIPVTEQFNEVADHSSNPDAKTSIVKNGTSIAIMRRGGTSPELLREVNDRDFDFR